MAAGYVEFGPPAVLAEQVACLWVNEPAADVSARALALQSLCLGTMYSARMEEHQDAADEALEVTGGGGDAESSIQFLGRRSGNCDPGPSTDNLVKPRGTTILGE